MSARKNIRKPKRQTRQGTNFNALGFVRAARSAIQQTQDAVQRVGNAILGGDYSGNARGQNAFDVQVYRDDPAYVASGDRSIAIGGGNNVAEGDETIAIGHDNQAVGAGAVAIGNTGQAVGEQSVSIGVSTRAQSGRSVAVGSGAEAQEQDALALGTSVQALGARSVAIGTTALASGDDEAVIAALTFYQQLGFGVKKAILRDGSSAGGDLSGTYPNPSVAWTNGYTVYDARYASASHAHDHGTLTGLSDDDHAQYALLAGRAGGQTLIGGTASGNNLTLRSTTHATRGKVVFGNAGATAYDEVNERFGIGTASPSSLLHLKSTAPTFRMEDSTASAKSLLLTVDSDVAAFDEAGGTRVLSVDLANNRATFGTTTDLTNGSRALNLIDANAVMRVMRLTSDLTAAAPAIELIGTPNANDATASFTTYWDIFLNASDMLVFRRRTGGVNVNKLYLDPNGNLLLGGASAAGTSAVGALAIKNGTAPSAAVADQFHLYAKDWAAGKSAPWFRGEDNTERAVLGVSATQGVSTGTGTVKMNGTTARNSVGWLTLHDHAGNTVYVPYWSVVTG